MKEWLQKKAKKLRHILSGPSNRPTVYFIPSDPLSEMYRVANEGIQEEVERKRQALQKNTTLLKEKAVNDTVAEKARRKLELMCAKKDRREIIRRIHLAKQGGAAVNPHYAKVIIEWNDQLQNAEEIIAKLSKE